MHTPLSSSSITAIRPCSYEVLVQKIMGGVATDSENMEAEQLASEIDLL